MSWILSIVLAFAAIRFWISFFNWLSRPYFKPLSAEVKNKVSVLIPARNEAVSIGTVLQSVLASEGVAFEVMVLDDHSEDETAAIVQKFAAMDRRLQLIRAENLPVGWLGKSWACHQLALAATGDWLVFLDADVVVTPHALHYAVATAEKQNLAGLSVFPNQQMLGWGEWLTVPLMHQLLLSMLPLSFIHWFKNPTLAAANGQCMVFRATDYREQCWHEQVKTEIVEDIAIFRKMKKAGKKVMTLCDPSGLLLCRMYRSLYQGIAGFSKNVLSGFGNSISFLLFYLVLTAYSWPLLWWLGARIQLAGLILVVLSIRVFVSLSAGQPLMKNLVLHFPQLLVFHLIAWKSIYQRLTGNYVWKGRKLS